METLGSRIVNARKRAGLQQKELAREAGLPDPRSLWRIESDKSKPSVEQLARIAAVLKVTTDSLLGVEQSQAELGASDSGTHAAVTDEQLDAEPATEAHS